MAQILARPDVQDALIVAAMAVVGAVIVALGVLAAYRSFRELSGQPPKPRR